MVGHVVSERLAKLNRETLVNAICGVQRGMTSRQDYEDHTVDELQDFLRERELAVSGTKSELVDRLVEDDEAEASESSEASESVPAEDPTQLPDSDPATAQPLVEEPETTVCEGSNLEIQGGPVPEEQRHPYPCPVCGKNFDFDPLDPEADPENDVIPEHDDIRLVPEEPAPPDTPPEVEPHFVQGRAEDLPKDEVESGRR
jgi:SAP domain